MNFPVVALITGTLGIAIAWSNQTSGALPQKICPKEKNLPCRIISERALQGTWVMKSSESYTSKIPRNSFWFSDLQAFTFTEDRYFKHLISRGKNLNLNDLKQNASLPSPNYQTYEFKDGFLWINHPERKPAPYYVLEFQEDRLGGKIKQGDIALWAIVPKSLSGNKSKQLTVEPLKNLEMMYVKQLRKTNW